MKMHHDLGNGGPSLTIGLGDYSGGQLYVDGRDDVELREMWVAFDGAVPHHTREFEGERCVFALARSSSLFWAVAGDEPGALRGR